MKTTIKINTILCILFSLLLICPLTQSQTSELESFITIKGIVKDKKSRKELPYVNISLPGTSIGTVTNEDGQFTLKLDKNLKADHLLISHLGYYNHELKIANSNKEPQLILMVPYANVIQEIIIHAQDPKDLVLAALKKVPNNYPTNPNILTGFYRETTQKGHRYINITEAISNIYKTSYRENSERDRVKIEKGRKLLSQKSSDTLAVKLMGGPNMAIFLDVVKNPDILFDEEYLPCYSFRMEEQVTINERPQYVISFIPQLIMPFALYEGTIYIDKENLAFTKAEFDLDLSDKNKATQAILRKKPLGLRFKPLEVNYKINYHQIGDKTYLSYMRNEVRFKCDWKKKLFSTSYAVVSEFVVTDINETTQSPFPYKSSFRLNQSLSDEVNNFIDPEFWGAYNIIEPTESLENAVKKLKKQQIN